MVFGLSVDGAVSVFSMQVAPDAADRDNSMVPVLRRYHFPVVVGMSSSRLRFSPRESVAVPCHRLGLQVLLLLVNFEISAVSFATRGATSDLLASATSS